MAIVLLNGAPRSGKSRLAQEIQARAPGVWLNFGVDAMMSMTPERWQPGMGLRPGASAVGPTREDYHRAWAAAAESLHNAGFHLVADLGVYEPELWSWIVARLRVMPLVTVGVQCSIDEVVRRRIATGWEPPHAEKATLWHRIHEGKTYDLMVDTGSLNSAQCAERVLGMEQVCFAPAGSNATSAGSRSQPESPGVRPNP